MNGRSNQIYYRWRRPLRALALLPAAFACTSAAVPPDARLFGNGRGMNMGTAVLAIGTPRTYQVQPARYKPAIVRGVADSGFGFVRLVITPTPLMADDPAARARALAWLAAMIDAYRAAGLWVVADLHFWSSDAPVTQDDVAPDPRRRAALIRAQVAVAQMLAARPRVALELLNEPPCWQDGKPFDWAPVQAAMVARVRAVAPRLPLVLTGCRGTAAALMALDAAPYRGDRNIAWTFHYYDPGAFVGQEEDGVRGVPFPPDPKLATDAATKMLPAPGSPRRNWLAARLDDYLRHNRGQATIRADMAAVAAWARRQGVPPGRILVGEFGVGLTPQKSPLLLDDAYRWLRAVRAEATARGFAWAYWTLPDPGAWKQGPPPDFPGARP
ncbi:glycoside hydrolase family 5 protein [Sphingomonas sp. R86520]|uniref:glycoside hydrolase family 5 protein n=1 Tax=Sphingomonas sp. R86520 TaxID=3093859 RepID=UPI0036D249D9